VENLYLIVGLGNPGTEYALTRHNVGFMAVERLAKLRQANWTYEKKFNARLSRLKIEDRPSILCEPQTYMNLSGVAVQAITDYYKISVDRLLVVVDDADLPIGEIRMRAEGSSGGHHGLESIEQHLATRGYARLRIGIGRQASGAREITDYVLGRYGPNEIELLNLILGRVVGQIESWLAFGIQRAMNEFNGVVKPPVQKEN
jgi:PTH1 family peptidyl-tRNA hydrolase